MRCLLVVPWILACGSSPRAVGRADMPDTARPASGVQPWAVPEGFRSETIPFPLEFAPSLTHQGVEELRFAPGFFDPAAPGYWAYAFAWRTRDAADLDAAALGAELTAYFRGLINAVDGTAPPFGGAAGRGGPTVDEAKAITDRAAIVAAAEAAGPRFTVTAHVFDAFKTKLPLDLVGWAERHACGGGAVWRFVLAPADSSLRPQLEALAAEATCDQPPPPAAPRPAPEATPPAQLTPPS